MQTVSEVMTRDVRSVSPQETLQQAAQMMNDLNVGVLPVCDGDRLVGMLTDRDITVRSASAGAAPADACVQDAMSTDVRWCFEDQFLDEVMQQMADSQVRRVPVISHDEAHRLIGIVALGDLATRTDETKKQEVEQVVEKVSSPSEPDRSQKPQGARTAGTGAADTAADETGIDIVGSPGAAIAPGAPAGDKDAIGPLPDDKITGAGRQGRVGFAGDPGGLSPADIEESQRQRVAAGGAASSAECAPTGGAAGAAGVAGGTDAAAGARMADTAGSKDAKCDTGTSGGGTDAAGAGGKAGGKTDTGSGSGGSKP